MSPEPTREIFRKQFPAPTAIGPRYSVFLSEWIRTTHEDLNTLIPALFQAAPQPTALEPIFRYMILGFLLGVDPHDENLLQKFTQISQMMLGMAVSLMKASELPELAATFRRARGQASWRLKKTHSRKQISDIRAGVMTGLATALQEMPLPGKWVLAGLREVRSPWPYLQGRYIDYFTDSFWPRFD